MKKTGLFVSFRLVNSLNESCTMYADFPYNNLQMLPGEVRCRKKHNSTNYSLQLYLSIKEKQYLQNIVVHLTVAFPDLVNLTITCKVLKQECRTCGVLVHEIVSASPHL